MRQSVASPLGRRYAKTIEDMGFYSIVLVPSQE
jgi:hypothetical protein